MAVLKTAGLLPESRGFKSHPFLQLASVAQMVEQRSCKPTVGGSSPPAGSSRGIAQSGSASALGAGGRGFKSLCPDHGGLAQLEEHLFCKQDVAGSIPAPSTILTIMYSVILHHPTETSPV